MTQSRGLTWYVGTEVSGQTGTTIEYVLKVRLYLIVYLGALLDAVAQDIAEPRCPAEADRLV